jgi:hypothetical protein
MHPVDCTLSPPSALAQRSSATRCPHVLLPPSLMPPPDPHHGTRWTAHQPPYALPPLLASGRVAAAPQDCRAVLMKKASLYVLEPIPGPSYAAMSLARPQCLQTAALTGSDVEHQRQRLVSLGLKTVTATGRSRPQCLQTTAVELISCEQNGHMNVISSCLGPLVADQPPPLGQAWMLFMEGRRKCRFRAVARS